MYIYTDLEEMWDMQFFMAKYMIIVFILVIHMQYNLSVIKDI
jgi:hypothetical protein